MVLMSWWDSEELSITRKELLITKLELSINHAYMERIIDGLLLDNLRSRCQVPELTGSPVIARF